MARLKEEQKELISLSKNQGNTVTRLNGFRKILTSGEIIEKFDRVIFESVIEKIIIGGYNSDGLEDPLKITLVYKTGIRSELDGRNFKPQRRNAAGVQIGEELCFHASNEGE